MARKELEGAPPYNNPGLEGGLSQAKAELIRQHGDHGSGGPPGAPDGASKGVGPNPSGPRPGNPGSGR